MTSEERARGFLDSWKFWVAIAYFGLVAVIVALYFLNRDVSREQAARAAEQKAGALAQRDDCYRRLEANPDLLALLETMADDRRDRIQASLDSIAAQPDSELNAIRRESIAKSRRAIRGIDRFTRQIQAATPSIDECDALSVRLGLQPKDSSS